ncbi:unnamed protein product [Vicia faba]|uniref:Uncharacterized protein n=1 Tax=Vicia faba TaxID=3906 RepID=A0AAV0YJX3_VICFA|nr:unnamed protein product [Vicia faba]
MRSQEEEAGEKGRRRKENIQTEVDDDVLITQIMNKILSNVTKTQKQTDDVEEETENIEESTVKRTLATNNKKKNKEKIEHVKETMITTKKSGAKRKKVESNHAKKNTLKRKPVTASDSEYDVEANVLDIVSSTRKKIGGRKIHVNVHDAPLNNVSFHTEGNVKKMEYICQIRVALEREISKNALGGHEVLKLLKEYGLMKIVSDIGPCYEKLIMEFIVNISLECNEEGNEEFKKVYVRGVV